MKILITGSTGLLGQALVSRLAPLGKITGLSRHAVSPAGFGAAAHRVCDLRDASQIAALVERVRPDAVVHTQAMSDVDRCELEPDLARAMNVEATEHLVQALRGGPALLLYLSTDYVFDGTLGRPYDERETPNPVSVYGRTKLDGEQAARRHPHTLVVRPSTLFGPARMNFCDAIVQLLQAGRPIDAFADQTTSPTFSEDLAEAIRGILHALRRSAPWPASRTVHVTNAGAATRVEFAHRVADLLGVSLEAVRPIRTTDQQRPARRPAYSVLISRELVALVGSALRPWSDAVRAYLEKRKESY